MIDHHGLSQSEERDYDSKAEGHFGSRHCDDEKDKEIAIHRAVITGKCDECENHPIEHELKGHIDDQRILAKNHPKHADREEQTSDKDKSV